MPKDRPRLVDVGVPEPSIFSPRFLWNYKRVKLLGIMRVPTTPQRSRMMSSIRGKNTWPERTLRTILFAKGFRYRLHVKKLPGIPDIVFPKHRAVVFVHGCFWHRHEGCRYTTTPRTNEKFWMQKFEGNVDRDRRHAEALHSLGWRVAVVWECALKQSVEDTARTVGEWLHGNDDTLVVGQPVSTSSGA
jgi:DNA mismatch endonuclease (patch repair protein)